jgi:hypothetical protein
MEFSDTGIGMSRSYVEKISEGSYLADRVHNEKLGGIGLGLPIVYGFVRKMNGFVSIESSLHQGTTIRITIPQTIVDDSPCLYIREGQFVDIAFYNMPGKYKVAQAREFYRAFASNLAQGLRINLYSVPTLNELKKLLGERDITNVFLGDEEYFDNPGYFEELAKSGVCVTVSASAEFRPVEDSHVLVMPKPLYSLPVVKTLSGDREDMNVRGIGEGGRA